MEITKELTSLTDTFRYLSKNINNNVYANLDVYGICVKKVRICEMPLRTHGEAFFMFYMFMYIFHMFYSDKLLSKDFWVK